MKFKFIDLFAGIGGFRIAFESAGAKCVFSSENDKYAQATYYENFEDYPSGDITKILSNEIPKHDILCAGFPCQPFSQAGVAKYNSLGIKHGFDHETKGTLFNDICRILKYHKPKAFLLENVKNLKGHDKGNTWKVIEESLINLGYTIYYSVIDAAKIVPQHRERVYIIGFREELKFEWPEIPDLEPRLNQILYKRTQDRYTLTDGVWKALKRHASRHKSKGNGFGYGIADRKGISRTLSARYYKDGAEILIEQKSNKNPRRLNPRECARLMGYSDSFKIPVSDNQAYKQFGNSVVVPLVKILAERLIYTLENPKFLPEQTEITGFAKT